jgi:sortase A
MRATNAVEGLFWTIGLACAAYLLLVAAQAQIYRHRAQNIAPAELSTRDVGSGEAESGTTGRRALAPGEASAAGEAPAAGDLIGRVDIPQLHLSVPVLEDDTAKSLLRGLGHIPGTAGLGGLGTVGLAGHRDTFLKPLRGIAPGMEIHATGATGNYRYVVDTTEIVMPEAVSVLAIHSRPELTLITCYPFSYVGAAPQRFVVHAHLVSVSPD